VSKHTIYAWKAKLVAQTAAFAVCGFSPIFLRKPADLKPAGPRYGLSPQNFGLRNTGNLRYVLAVINCNWPGAK